jgi:molybdenum cofactor synthesis domain-containing protein
MPRFLRVMTLEETSSELTKHWKPQPKAINLPLSKAGGRVLAEDVFSKIDVPPFDRAAMDGYAIRAIDTFAAVEDRPIHLKFVGRLLAGNWSPRIHLHAGECIEIATGAPMPMGADAVVMVEHAMAREKTVDVYRAVAPGENVARRASEIKRGATVLRAGKRLTPSSIGTLAAIGEKMANVYKRPRVAVISSGAELRTPGSKLGRSQVYDVNGPTICRAVEDCGGETEYLGIARDQPSQIIKLVKKGISSSDIVIISGGSSAGSGDIVPSVVDSLGKPGVIVHGLALKPGKPTFVAVVRGKPVFGLPGYPVSALIVFDQLVAPYLRTIASLPPIQRKIVQATLSTKILSARGRREFVPVQLVRGSEGLNARPILKGSGAITALSAADGYIEVPLEEEIVREGELVKVVLFGEIENA